MTDVIHGELMVPVLPTHVTSGLLQRVPIAAEIRIVTPNESFRVPLGDGTATPTDGFAGYDEVERAENVSLTEWNGTATLKMDVPVFLDGWAERRSVEHEIARLEHLARRPDGSDQPPAFRVYGPIPYSGRKWVMANITFGTGEGEVERDERHGRRIRQVLTLNLMEHSTPDRIRFHKVHKSGAKNGQRFYTTKKGDTLNQIAAKLYKDPDPPGPHTPSIAQQIGKLNKIRDPRKRLKAGIKLRLP
jgi:hypothetical protein